MGLKFILFERSDGVARITLHRPDKMNSFNHQMAQELQQVLSEVSADQSVRSVYLTGSGRGFCAGQDLADAMPATEASETDLSSIVRASYNPIVRELSALPKPVVCGVNGVAAGAGANLALACDIVIAAESASFIQSFSKIGLVPDTGGSFFLPRLVGMARASALMLLGEKISATRAEEIGMIYKVCQDDMLEASAYGLAVSLSTQPTAGLALIKRELMVSQANDLETQLEVEADFQGLAGRTSDFKEGVSAFLEKRKPDYTGD